MSQAPRTSGQSNTSFLALVLIGIGVIWLLGQLNVFSGASFAVLARFWPLILVAIGINLLVGRGSPQFARLVALITVVALLALMLIGPTLGLAQRAEVRTESFNAALEDVETAEIHIGPSLGETTVTALDDSNQLFTADLRFIGNVRFEDSGGSNREITLASEGTTNTGFFDFTDFGWGNNTPEDDLRWNIGLAPNIPTELSIEGGVGGGSLDLREISLLQLELNGGVGETTVSLPAMDERYEVIVNGGVGGTRFVVPEGALVSFEIDGGVGGVTIDIPEGAAVRIEKEGGLGGVDLPAGFDQVRGDNNDGVWESSSFDDEDNAILINVDGGVGGVTVR